MNKKTTTTTKYKYPTKNLDYKQKNPRNIARNLSRQRRGPLAEKSSEILMGGTTKLAATY